MFNYKTNVKIHYVKSLYVFYFKYILRIFKKKNTAVLTKNVNIVLPKKQADLTPGYKNSRISVNIRVCFSKFATMVHQA